MSTVKYMHSAMTGAPTLSGVAGTLISVLDAFLVNGFGSQTASSVVVASNVCTVTVPSSHPFEVDSTITIAGATPAGLNGDWTVSAIGANTVSFVTSGISNQTATGTITVKLTPAGWAKVYSGTNLAVYRSPDVTGTRRYLRVDDTGTTNARVVGYEAMTDVNTGTNPFPSALQVSGGAYWPKANAANATARGWTLVGDAKTFYLHTHTATVSIGSAGLIWGFGDFSSERYGDPYACVLFASPTDVAAGTAAHGSSLDYSRIDNTTDQWVCRSYTGVGSSVAVTQRAESYQTVAALSGSVTNSLALYPNQPNNRLLLSRKLLVEAAPALRGVVRGVSIAAQNCHASFAWRDKVDGAGDLTARKLLAIKGGGSALTTSASVIFTDITGPWA
jgi:hypothetical protein